MPGFDGVKETVRRLIEIAEAVVGDVDDIVAFGKKDNEHLLFFLGDKGRDHDGALTGSLDTAVHVVTEGLVIACDGFVYEVVANMNGRVAKFIDEFDIAHSTIFASCDNDIVLYTEETWLETLSSEALGIHVDVLIGSGELIAVSHRGDVGHSGKDGWQNCVLRIGNLPTE